MQKLKKKVKFPLLIITLFTTFTFCLYAPFEMYLLNREDMWFNLSLFWWMPIGIFVITFFILYFIGVILQKFKILYNCFLGGVFGVGVCLYIQANLIGIKVGLMNGYAIDWSLYRSRMIKDLILWGIVIAFTCICNIWKPKMFTKLVAWASGFITMVLLVTLVTLFVTAFTNGELSKKSKGKFITDNYLFEVGSDENVVVFLLDMFDDRYFKEILEQEPDIQNQLDGFTYFNNNTGLYSTTVYSTLNLFTGKIFHNEDTMHNWCEQQSKQRLYLDELVDAGFDLSVYAEHTENLPDRFETLLINNEQTTLQIKNNLQFIKTLYSLAGCKYLPDYFKTIAWLNGTEFDEERKFISNDTPYNIDNRSFRDSLQANELQVKNGAKEFKFIHTTGVHYPYFINEKGQDVEENSVDAITCARGSLLLAQEYIDMMKEKNVYDNSTIIIMADHGYYRPGVLSNPVLLIKQKGKKGKLEVNNAPVCQADFPATVVDCIDLGDKNQYGISAFDVTEDMTPKRLYYVDEYYYEKHGFRLIEYLADDHTNDTSLFKLTDVEYTFTGDKIKHSVYCKTCQDGGTVLYDYDVPRLVHEMADNYPK